MVCTGTGFGRKMKIGTRAVGLSDAGWILKLMNQPSVRKVSFSQNKITKKENENYWKRKLKQKKFRAYAMLAGGVPAGLIRIAGKTLSFATDEKFRGKGIAYRALSQLDLEGCVAKIKPNNAASAAILTKLGFIGEKMGVFAFRRRGGIRQGRTNVLITSASAKVLLVQAFMSALKAENDKGKVIAVDSDPLSAALYASDKHYVVPKSDRPGFGAALEKICRKEKIRLLVPTRDAELAYFAENRKRFESLGTNVLVSDPETIGVCRDKELFYNFAVKNSIPVPETTPPKKTGGKKPKFPLIVKPRFGSASGRVFKARSRKELDFFSDYVHDAVVQEFIAGKEFTIDTISDFQGKMLAALPRERIKTRAGESSKARTVSGKKMVSMARKVVELLGIIGPANMQCIKGRKGLRVLEVNPRFAGASALSFRAGMDSPRILLRLLNSRNPMPPIKKFRENLVMLRHASDIYIENPNRGGAGI